MVPGYSIVRRFELACIVTLAALALTVSNATAADKLIVGKSVPFAFTFIPMDVGVAAGTWAKYGIDPDIISLGGGAKVAQALTAGSVDIGLGSGPLMGFMAKGVPAKGVAAFAGPPRSMSVLVAYHSPITSPKQLKGKKMGVTTVGSLTAWMTRRLSETEGWGPNGIQLVTLASGGMAGRIAALKLGQIDALMSAPEIGYLLEQKKEGRILVDMSSFVKHFVTHVIYARDELIKKKPDVVERFLKGWFATIAYMRSHKQQTVDVASRILKQDKEVMSRTYDREMPEMSSDGRFEPKAVATVRESLLQMGILKKLPKNNVMFTTRFVPVKF